MYSSSKVVLNVALNDADHTLSCILDFDEDGNVVLNLNAPDGSVVRGTVWTMDSERGSLGLNIDAEDLGLDALLD